MADSDLFAANKRLADLRVRARSHKKDKHFLARRQKTAVSPSPVAVIPWQLYNAQQQLNQERQRHSLLPSSWPHNDQEVNREIAATPSHLTATTTDTVTDSETDSSYYAQTVKCYPSIGIGAFKCEATAIYRIWLLCRWQDANGRGWLDVADIRHTLTEAASPYHLVTWRRLRQLLNEGNDRLWQWDRENGRLWLQGAAAVATAFEVPRLTGTPVALPITALIQGIGLFRATLYAAWHGGRHHPSPISRSCQRRLLHIPERTQQLYTVRAKMCRITNYAIGAIWTQEAAQEAAWQWGQGVFTFIDYNGRQGPKNRRYIARQLPNSYETPLKKAAKGRQKKVNGHLVTNGERGKVFSQLFYANGAAAVKGAGQNSQRDQFWPLRGRKKAHQLWHHVCINPINGRKKFPRQHHIYKKPPAWYKQGAKQPRLAIQKE